MGRNRCGHKTGRLVSGRRTRSGLGNGLHARMCQSYTRPRTGHYRRSQGISRSSRAIFRGGCRLRATAKDLWLVTRKRNTLFSCNLYRMRNESGQRQPRSQAREYELRRTPEPHDADAYAPFHSAHEWIFQETRQSRLRRGASFHVQQLCSDSFDLASDSRYGAWAVRPRMGTVRTYSLTSKLSRYPPTAPLFPQPSTEKNPLLVTNNLDRGFRTLTMESCKQFSTAPPQALPS